MIGKSDIGSLQL